MRNALVLAHTLHTLATNSPLENLCVAIAAFALIRLINAFAERLTT